MMVMAGMMVGACGGPAGGPATTSAAPGPATRSTEAGPATREGVHPFTRQMEGMWHQYGGVANGREVGEEQYAGHGSLFTARTWQWCLKGKAEGPPLEYTVSGDGPAYALDVVWGQEAIKGQRQLGIVMVDERGELVTCIAPVGKARPTKFESAVGSGVNLQRYRRVLGEEK